MKKWLTGLFSGAPNEKKKGQKEMSKAKPVKAAAAKAGKTVKPAAKVVAQSSAKASPITKPLAKAPSTKSAKAPPATKSSLKAPPQTESSASATPQATKAALKAKTDEAAKASPKAKPLPTVEKTLPAVEAEPSVSKAEKKPKKSAEKEKVPHGSGIVDTATPENKKKWKELREKFAREKAAPYNMAAQFEADRPLEHKVLGWGYIMTNNNDRLEVLFETGVKILISNYRS